LALDVIKRVASSIPLGPMREEFFIK